MPTKTLYQGEFDSQINYHGSFMEKLAEARALFDAMEPLRASYPSFSFSADVNDKRVVIYAYGLTSPRDTVALRRDLAGAGFHLEPGSFKKREDGWNWILVNPALGSIRIYGILDTESTTCRRVLVRTETREVPVYEIECDIKE